MKLTPKQIKDFQSLIFSWWKGNRRDLPWRRTHDPYKILVSEVMLQQTQVSRVLPKYVEFIQAFPTVTSLAKASPGDVLRLWKGMGYNRRALYLYKAAQAVTKEYKNKFPTSEQSLTKLPGVGIYTARAVLVFAFKQEVAAVDTNIRQIIVHHFFKNKPQSIKIIQETADVLVPKGKSWEWHQALMDYGAIQLSKLNRSARRPELSLGRSRRATTPFRESNRFYRGRIIDRLRVSSVTEKDLIRDMKKKYQKDASFISSLFTDLQEEGLIEKKRNIFSLPT